MNIKIENNKFNFKLEDLMVVAHRANNPKRNFLFVSKLLGKHIEVRPNVCRATGRLLASLAYEDNCVNYDITAGIIKGQVIDDKTVLDELNTPIKANEKAFVLGFAETATGLGMAVASSIEGCHYQTTTREAITEIKNILSFEEEHSHATNHKCFSLDETAIMKADRIILVDDEITTGNSMRNLIRELCKITPIKKYTILSILDWRTTEYRKNMDLLREELQIDVDVLSIMSGTVEVSDTSVYVDSEPESLIEEISVEKILGMDRFNIGTDDGIKSYYKHSGRFGVEYGDIAGLEDKCKSIAEIINQELADDEKLLVMGHGEDIYIPSRVAAYIKGDVKFKTTTRSPIYCEDKENYPIRTKHSFKDNDVTYYLYNKNEMEENFDKVILLTEGDLNIKLTNNIKVYKI